jgi:hypothetical protein
VCLRVRLETMFVVRSEISGLVKDRIGGTCAAFVSLSSSGSGEDLRPSKASRLRKGQDLSTGLVAQLVRARA